MTKYRIIGKGGLQSIIIELLQNIHLYDGYYDDKVEESKNYKGSIDNFSISEVTNFILAFASIRNMLRREFIFFKLKNMGGHPINAISNKANIFSSVKMGEGNILCPFANLSANVEIGSNCIIFSNTTIEHDCHLGNNVNIAPGVSFGGGVTVDKNVFVGVGAKLKDGISIGKNVIIGSGSLILQNIPDNVIVYGSPAKVIGENKVYETNF